MLAACSQKEVLVEENQDAAIAQETESIFYIEASAGSDTKAKINDETAAFSWHTGDQIAVYAGGYKISNGLSTFETSNASFAFKGEDFNSDRENFAIYPAALVHNGTSPLYTTDVTASSLKLNLPASYNLSKIYFENSPVPMIAANAPDGNLEFKHLGALLRFKLISVPKQTQYITFDFNGKKVQGEFTLTSVTPGTSVIATSDTDGNDDIVTVYNDGVFSTFQTNLIVNMPVPTGVYTDVTITTWDGEPGNGGHKINALTTPVDATANWIASRKTAHKRDVYLPVFTINGNIGLTNGTKAVFAPGNLQAILESAEPYATQGTNSLFAAQAWKFADHQYDALGNKTPHELDANDERNTYSMNSLQDRKDGDTIDLFAWTGAQASYFTTTDRPESVKYGIFMTTNGSGTSTFIGNSADELLLADWGHNAILDEYGEYPEDTWRTPTKVEWDRVIQGRKDPDNNSEVIAHGAKGKIVKSDTDPTVVAYGLFLLPDRFSYPAGVPVLQKVAGTDAYSGSGGQKVAKYDQSSGGATCNDNSYTLAEWGKMEAAGCVFLPLTNHRHNANTPYKGEALYWNKDIQSGKSTNWTLAFNFITEGYTASLPSTSSNSLQSGKSTTRHFGCAVRLVRQVN